MSKDLTKFMNKIENPKEEAAQNLRNITKLCSNFLIQPHIESGARTFAASVLNEVANAGDNLNFVTVGTKESKDAISVYVEKCSLAEPDGDSILVAIDENHMELINASMKLSIACGAIAEAIRLNTMFGKDLDEYETKTLIGNSIQAICMLCNKLNIPFIDCLICNFKQLKDLHPDSFV